MEGLERVSLSRKVHELFTFIWPQQPDLVAAWVTPGQEYNKG